MIVGKEDNQQTEQIAVRVLFFGAARDAVGHSEATFSLSGPVNGAGAFEQVLARFPSLRRFGRSLLFAINEEYAPADREVHEGDELAVFPPVSGGAARDGEIGRSETLIWAPICSSLASCRANRNGYLECDANVEARWRYTSR